MAARECAKCGREFEGRKDAKYCGSSCRSAATKEAQQSRTKARSRASTRLTSAVTRSTNAARKDGGVSPRDAAAIALAREYARQIDANPAALGDLGPQLRLILDSLTMTPKGRAAAAPAAARGRPTGDSASSADGDNIATLRDRWDRRADRAKDMDSPAS